MRKRPPFASLDLDSHEAMIVTSPLGVVDTWTLYGAVSALDLVWLHVFSLPPLLSRRVWVFVAGSVCGWCGCAGGPLGFLGPRAWGCAAGSGVSPGLGPLGWAAVSFLGVWGFGFVVVMPS